MLLTRLPAQCPVAGGAGQVRARLSAIPAGTSAMPTRSHCYRRPSNPIPAQHMCYLKRHPLYATCLSSSSSNALPSSDRGSSEPTTSSNSSSSNTELETQNNTTPISAITNSNSSGNSRRLVKNTKKTSKVSSVLSYTAQDIPNLDRLAEVLAPAGQTTGGPLQIDIDLGGQELAAQWDDVDPLVIRGKGRRVRIDNGKLVLPWRAILQVTAGAHLELSQVEITYQATSDTMAERRLPDLKSGIVAVSKPGTTALLDGCTVRRVPTFKPRTKLTEMSMAGVWVKGGAAATLKGCWVEGTYAGVHVQGGNSKAMVESSFAKGCFMAGFMASKGGALTADRCVALNNVAHGFFAQHEGSHLEARDCRSEIDESCRHLIWESTGFQAVKGATVAMRGDCTAVSK